MRRSLVCALLGVCAWGIPDAALGQQGLTLAANVIFYGDNTEFRNPFREGETIFGSAARLEGRISLGDSVELSLGVFGNQRFGSESGFELVRPVAALAVTRGRSRFVFGTLDAPFELGTEGPSIHPATTTPPIPTTRVRKSAGPDRTGPHGLLPPLQRESLAFDRPYEAGLQWTFDGPALNHEAWLQWQRINTPAHRERLDAGVRTAWRVRRPLILPFQTHIVHEGGQLYSSGPVRDSLAMASGIVLANAESSGVKASLELLGLWSRYTPDRAAARPTRNGGAFFGRASADRAGWRAHFIAWRGDDFIKDEGDPNYLSVRRNGARWRGVRDYAEIGLTRTFTPAPGALVEASFRFHRIEDYYEYSYRVLAVVRARAKIR
jgi:hypothetical protein